MPTTATLHPPGLHGPFIQQQLPDWLKHLSPADLQRLGHSLFFGAPRLHQTDWFGSAEASEQATLRTYQQRCRASAAALGEALKGLQNIAGFAEPRLRQALQETLQIAPDIFTTQFVQVNYESTLLGAQLRLVPRQQSLLQAALQNFAGDAEFASGTALAPKDSFGLDLVAGTGVDGKVPRFRYIYQEKLEVEPQRFARLCHALDLGGQYQRHLAEIYDAPGRKAQLRNQWIKVYKDQCRVQIQLAFLQGRIDDSVRQVLFEVLQGGARRSWFKGYRLRISRVQLFGAWVGEALFLRTEGDSGRALSLLYLPGAPSGSITRYASGEQLHDDFRQRLLGGAYRNWLRTGLAADKLAQTLSKLDDALYEWVTVHPGLSQRRPVANAKLFLRAIRIHGDAFEFLYAEHERRLKADARYLVVPSADVDEQAREQRLAQWESIGFDLLNAVAFFVPAVAAVMMLVSVVQMVGEVIDAAHAWADGDLQQAWAHIQSVGLNVAFMVGMGVAGRKLATMQESELIDRLRPVRLANGQKRLWQINREPYARDVDLSGVSADQRGLYRLQQRTYARIAGRTHEVQENGGTWQVCHPDAPYGYQPALQHNGEGAWWFRGESPLDWDRTQLLRRIGPLAEGIDDELLAMAADISATSDERLRQLFLYSRRLPPLLRDTLQRLRLDRDIEQWLEHLRKGWAVRDEAALCAELAVALPGWPQRAIEVHNAAAQQVFGHAAWRSLPAIRVQGQVFEAILAGLDDVQLERLLGEPLPRAQRAQRLREKLAEQGERQRSLLFERLGEQPAVPLPADVQRLQRMFPLLTPAVADELLAGVPRVEREELARGLAGPSLRLLEQARVQQREIRLNRAIEGLYRHTLSGPDSERLMQGLLPQLPGWNSELAVEGHEQPLHGQTLLQVGPAVLRCALRDRAQAAALLGQQPIRPWFRSPLRLPDGRLGYPLGGSGSCLSSSNLRLRDLFPEISGHELEQLRHSLLVRYRHLGDAVSILEMEFEQLEFGLQQWAGAGSDGIEVGSRETVCLRILQAWRGRGSGRAQVLDLSGLVVSNLPELFSSFNHIDELRMSEMHLAEVPVGFLKEFGHLQVLALNHNHLLELPPALGWMSRLRRLDLQGNRLTPHPQMLDNLRPLTHLHSLNLGSNGLLLLPPDAQQVLAGLPRLRSLNLSSNQLTPDTEALRMLCGLPLESLDLADNLVRLSPERAQLFAQMRTLRRLNLSGNPLVRAPELTEMAALEQVYLRRCLIREWPQGLSQLMDAEPLVLRVIDLSANALTELPELAATGFCRALLGEGPHERRFLLDHNRFEPAALNQLEAIGANLRRVRFSEDPIDGWLHQASVAERDLWANLFRDRANLALKDMLERMLLSHEYQRQPDAVKPRIWNLLKAAAEHSELREELLAIAEGYPATCGDAGADAFSELELALLAFNRSQAAATEGARHSGLLAFYQQLFRRAQVIELAERIALRRTIRRRALLDDSEAPPALDALDDISDRMLRRHEVDDVEVRLAIRQELAGLLDYPELSVGMLYRDMANVSPSVLNKVRRAVRKRDTAENCQQWMVGNFSWQRYLKQRFAAQFEIITGFWSEGLDYLDYCLGSSDQPVGKLDRSVLDLLGATFKENLLDDSGQLRKPILDEQRYLQAVEALRLAHQRAEEALMLNLTRSEGLSH